MSTKTYVSLYKENEKISEHQLFGNDDIFQSFNDYLKSIGVNYDDEGTFGFDYGDNEDSQLTTQPHKIPNLTDFIKAIEEVIYDKAKDETQLVSAYPNTEFDKLLRPTNTIFDLSRNFIVEKGFNQFELSKDLPLAYTFHVALSSVYMGETYRLINWLIDYNAIKTDNFVIQYRKPELTKGYSLKIERW